MRRQFAEYGLFLKEFWRNYHTTGAILPSGRFLASALARYVREAADHPRRILEVGPGTGPVTKRIIALMQPQDRLDLVELNDSFVEGLQKRLADDPAFQPAADRCRVLHCPVEELPPETQYDLIISGLPLNNFKPDEVQAILDAMRRLLKPGGTLSFFEYIAIRRVKSVISPKRERVRLQGVGQVMGDMLGKHEIRCDWVWPNAPPAWVHHVRPQVSG